MVDSAERRKIDDAVFDALSLTKGERHAVYEGMRELVENRLRGTRSTRGRGRLGRRLVQHDRSRIIPN